MTAAPDASTLRSVNTLGRNVAGWIGIVAVLGALYLAVAGLAYPKALEPVERALCPPGASLVTGTQLDAQRTFAKSSAGQYCSSTKEFSEVTGRWVMCILSLVAIAGVAGLVRVKLTPPRLRAPALPGAG